MGPLRPLRLYLIPGLILLAAFGLRVFRLDAQSLWYDEGYSLHLASLPLPEMTRWTTRDVVPPLYYGALHFWIGAAGSSEFAARMLSVCLGVLALPLGYRIAARWFDRRAGLLAMLLLALSPLYVWHSQDARMYMPMTTANLIALWALTMLLQTSQVVRRTRGSHDLTGLRQWWWLWGVALVAMIYLHTTGVFIAAAQTLMLLPLAWRQKRLRPVLARALWVGTVALLAYVPWLWLAWREYTVNAGYFPGTLPPLTVISTALRTFSTGDVFAEPAASILAGVLLMVLCLAALALARSRSPLIVEPVPSAPATLGQAKEEGGRPAVSLGERSSPALFLLLSLLLPLLLMAAAFYRVPKFAPRYTLAISPTFFVLLAGGLTLWLRRPKGFRIAWAVLTFILAVFAVGVGLIYTDARLAKDDLRGAAHYLQSHIAPDETVLLLSGHFQTAWDYYYSGERTPLPDIPILDLNKTLNYAAADTLNMALANKRGAWVVRWQDEVIDPNGFVRMFLDQAGQPQPIPVTFSGVKLWHYRWDASPQFSNQPDITQPLNLRFGQIELLGYKPITDTLMVYWQADRHPERDYGVTLRLYDEQQRHWGSWDQRLSTFLYPTTAWKPGEVLFGHYPLPANPGTPPGRYILRLSVYEENGPAVQMVDSAGRMAGQWLSLPVTLTRTWMPQDIPAQLAPALAQPMNDDLALLSHTLRADQVYLGAPIQLALYWQARRTPAADYYVRAEWLSGANASYPLAAQHPTHDWRAAESVQSQLALHTPAAPGTYPLRIQLLDAASQPASEPLTLDSVTVPPVQRISGATFGSGLTLLGADVSAERLRPGGSVRLTLYWRAEKPIESNLTVFTHMLGQDDRPVAQHDGLPAQGARPTNTWRAAEVIRDIHEWVIPADTPLGTYRIKVGWYDSNQPGLPRLPVLGLAGQTISDGALLGTLEVAR